MKIDQQLCIGCGECLAYCPVEAISMVDTASIDNDLCLECHICFRANICPVEAIEMEELEWPRVLRSAFSDVLNPHKNTGVAGRGTEEMKTNEVTGRLKKGRAGIAVELGRPGLGVYFRDAEKVAMAVAKHNVQFEPENPIDSIMEDKSTGKFMQEVLNERALSAIIEFDVPLTQLKDVLLTIKDVSKEIDTVFSLDVATLMDGERIPTDEILEDLGFTRRINGKTNVGLGRPRKACV